MSETKKMNVKIYRGPVKAYSTQESEKTINDVLDLTKNPKKYIDKYGVVAHRSFDGTAIHWKDEYYLQITTTRIVVVKYDGDTPTFWSDGSIDSNSPSYWIPRSDRVITHKRHLENDRPMIFVEDVKAHIRWNYRLDIHNGFVSYWCPLNYVHSIKEFLGIGP